MRNVNRVALVLATIGGVLAIYIAQRLGLNTALSSKIDRIAEIYLSRPGEYLFFLGTTILARVLFRRGHWIVASLSLIAGLIWVAFFGPVADFLRPLGIDSFTEAADFDYAEALFYLESVRGSVYPDINLKVLALYAATAILVDLLVRWGQYILRVTGRRFDTVRVVLAAALIVSAMYFAYEESISQFVKASSTFLTVLENFDNEAPRLAHDNKGIKIVVYVGESTSAMNLGIYGYPRNTTPRLDQLLRDDRGLLVFWNVFSTHSLTSQSLLEALSFGVGNSNKYIPIRHRSRVSLVDVLLSGGIQVLLFSNQGQAGSWNEASTVIFRNATRTFSIDSKVQGNLDFKMSRPPDHVFFGQHLMPALERLSEDESAVLFLHSYAGHGRYLRYIPEAFREPVDDFISSRDARSVVGENVRLATEVEEYDSAMRYIDHSISETIESIRFHADPVLLIYFADHGDAAYAGLGHDSARFIHEMARVPFLLYFNETARIAYPDLVQKYRDFSHARRTSTLADLPYTIIDLLGGRIDGNMIDRGKLVGSIDSEPTQPILVREINDGYSFVNLNEVVPDDSLNGLDSTDPATRSFVVTEKYGRATNKVCYHRANTLGKAIRGALVSNCLEVDLMVGVDGSLDVYHPPAVPVGLSLQDIVDLATDADLALWIDGKNLGSTRTCLSLLDLLSKPEQASINVLVEFPSDTPFDEPGLAQCTQRMIETGFRTSYYVDTAGAISCAESVRGEFGVVWNKDCTRLEEKLESAVESGYFTDLSFDYAGVAGLESIGVAGKLQWNTWNVDARAFSSIDTSRFQMVILNNNDPNHH